jgi:hypothetical protein
MTLNSFRGGRARQALTYQRFYAVTSRFKPRHEQAKVVKWLQTHNVVVSAHPGAGKKVAIAIITYSKRLQLDTEESLKKYVGVVTYTLHGLTGRLFGCVTKGDTDLITERYS